jgi:Trypsin
MDDVVHGTDQNGDIAMVSWETLGGTGTARRRRLLAALCAVSALLLLVTVGSVTQQSQAATGMEWDVGETFVGVMTTDATRCTVTVVSRWMAITAKHCGTSNPQLKLAVTGVNDSDPTHVYRVRRIVQHPSLDVEALYLEQPTTFTTTMRFGEGTEYTPGAPVEGFGYGLDRRNADLAHLEMAEFRTQTTCPSSMDRSGGDFCFDTTYQESFCSGDSGGPLIQGDVIVGMATSVLRNNPSGPMNCEDVKLIQGLAMSKIVGWVNDRNSEASLS